MSDHEWKFGDIVSFDPWSPAGPWRFMLIVRWPSRNGPQWRAWPLVYIPSLVDTNGLPHCVFIAESNLYLIEAAA